MDLSFTEAEERFAGDVREWLGAHVQVPERFETIAEEVDFGRAWQAELAAGRWVGIHWPAQYGGRGATPVEVALYNMEYARSRALQPVNRVGINLAGPTLLAHGTEEQKIRIIMLLSKTVQCAQKNKRLRRTKKRTFLFLNSLQPDKLCSARHGRSRLQSSF